MEAPLPFVLASPQKRPHVDDVEPAITTPNRSAPSNASTPLTVISSLETPSPIKPKQCAANTPSKSNNSVAGDGPASMQPASAAASTQQAAKRRKLTQQEKEEQAKEKEKQAKEKEIKAQARAEKKAQEEKLKAEQKAQKDEEKRAKDEEKRKKNEEKEEKKRAKELKQQHEEEEKRKKERVSTSANVSSLFVRIIANYCIVPDEAQRFFHKAQGCRGVCESYHGRAHSKTLHWRSIFINRDHSDCR